MSNKLLFPFLFCLLMLSAGCEIEFDNGKYADEVVGTYTITSLDSTLGSLPQNGDNKIVITKINNTFVDVLVDFSSTDDLSLDNVELSKAGSDINMDKEYSNASLTGYVSGATLKLRLDYSNEDFIEFDAER